VHCIRSIVCDVVDPFVRDAFMHSNRSTLSLVMVTLVTVIEPKDAFVIDILCMAIA